jgi:hypothetical protein
MAKEFIRACPFCANPDLKWVGGGANLIFDYLGTTSLSGKFQCYNCGREVLPIEFDSKAAYLQFVKSKSTKAKGAGARVRKTSTKPAGKSRKRKAKS